MTIIFGPFAYGMAFAPKEAPGNKLALHRVGHEIRDHQKGNIV